MSRSIKAILIFLGFAFASLGAQDSLATLSYSSGWADQAVTIGYITAPATISLMFISALVNEWNAGYAGIPASAMILLAPPLIYAGGRSVNIQRYFTPQGQAGMDPLCSFHHTHFPCPVWIHHRLGSHPATNPGKWYPGHCKHCGHDLLCLFKGRHCPKNEYGYRHFATIRYRTTQRRSPGYTCAELLT